MPFQIPKSADVREGESEAKLILVSHGAERKSTILHADAAAIPVVGTLQRAVLQEGLVGVKADAGGSAYPTLRRTAKASDDAELVKAVRRGDRIRNKDLAGRMKEDMTGAGKVIAEMVIEENSAGVGAGHGSVVVELPGDVHIVRCADAKARDDGRKAPRRGKKGEAGKLRTAGKDVALAVDQRAAEGGVEEILLRQLPGDEFVDGGVAGLVRMVIAVGLVWSFL